MRLLMPSENWLSNEATVRDDHRRGPPWVAQAQGNYGQHQVEPGFFQCGQGLLECGLSLPFGPKLLTRPLQVGFGFAHGRLGGAQRGLGFILARRSEHTALDQLVHPPGLLAYVVTLRARRHQPDLA